MKNEKLKQDKDSIDVIFNGGGYYHKLNKDNTEN